MNTPPLKSTLITSTTRVEAAVQFLRPGDQLKRANIYRSVTTMGCLWDPLTKGESRTT